jgi:hypothetical protein
VIQIENTNESSYAIAQKYLTFVGTGRTDGLKLYSPLIEVELFPFVSIPIQSARSTGLESAVESPTILVDEDSSLLIDRVDSMCRDINLVRLTIASRTA